MRLAVNFPAFVNDMLSIVHNNFEQIVLAVIASFIAGLLLFVLGIPTKLLQRHFAKKDQKEQQKRELEQNKKDAQKPLKRCVEKIITDWEEPIKSESLEKEMSIKRKKLHDNGIKLKEVVADYEEYLPSETVKEALDIARDMKETSTLNVRVYIINKPADEQPDVIFKKRGDRVVERAKELIKRL